jgi:methylase of polypeptide subunit release factors
MDEPMSKEKTRHGQFYTIGNPFTYKPFKEWFQQIGQVSDLTVVEPFGGANNLILLADQAHLGLQASQWSSFDLYPETQAANVYPQVPVQKRDTIKNPVSSDLVITNPPYLAKNSAKRMGIHLDFGKHQDLYEISLETVLNNTKWVAAIIPESFITRDTFRERLWGVISIPTKMFNDTEFPVCLALWNPEATKSYKVFSGNTLLGVMPELFQKNETLCNEHNDLKIVFNDKEGFLGLKAVDNTVNNSIVFVEGNTIAASSIKVSSRAITRISLWNRHSGEQLSESYVVKHIIPEANRILAEFREETHDVFLTSFKGLRKDGKYRRRLDYATAGKIIQEAYYSLQKKTVKK